MSDQSRANVQPHPKAQAVISATVAELQPGDVVNLTGADFAGIFVGSSLHPVYPGLTCVVWLLTDGRWSVDALSPWQVVGDAVRHDDPEERIAFLNRRLAEVTVPDVQAGHDRG